MDFSLEIDTNIITTNSSKKWQDIHDDKKHIERKWNGNSKKEKIEQQIFREDIANDAYVIQNCLVHYKVCGHKKLLISSYKIYMMN